MRDPRWPSALFPLVLAFALSPVSAAEGQEPGETEVPEAPRTFSRPETAGPEMDPSPGGEGPEALSPRNADYRIEVALDPETQILDGRQVLTWTNRADTAADELRFHLYWNAWRNDRSTWMREERLTGDRPEEIREEGWGWIEVDRILLLRDVRAEQGEGGTRSGATNTGEGGTVDLTGDARHVTPDDDNEHDRTVLAVPLPAPVLPGETVRVEMNWRARVPRTFARTGRRGDFYFVAHWFPKLGVFEGPDGWNCHQYHSNTEYYSDYGVYDVSITVPDGFVVGATGREEQRSTENGMVTRRFVQPDVHAFTWTAFPGFQETERRFDVEGLPAVDVRLLYQPEHVRQVERHFHATFAALDLYGRWYGAYPYDHLTVVDPAWGSGAGGMEYPTLFTSGTRILNPFGGGSPEGVTVHEAGHQFWYGVVGNNEFEHAWLDEGLNTFSTARVMQKVYGPSARRVRYLRPPGTDWRGFLPVLFRGIREEPLARRLRRYRENADWDVPSDPTFRYYPEAHGDVSYSKTALWLATLEGYLGWDVLREILSTFYERWSFRHPGPEDFFAVASEVAAERFDDERSDLEWFFDQVHRSAVTFDYQVVRADSFAADVEGFVREGGEMVYRAGDAGSEEDVATWRSEVVVRRSGQGYFPVDVLLTFEDGTEVRERWDGRERWRLFVHEGPSKLASAAVDPDRILRLDLHPSNNARLVEPNGSLASVKWAGKWMIWLQDLMQTFAFFA